MRESEQFNRPGDPKLTGMEKLILDRLRSIPAYNQFEVIAVIGAAYSNTRTTKKTKIQNKVKVQNKGNIITLPALNKQR